MNEINNNSDRLMMITLIKYRFDDDNNDVKINAVDLILKVIG